MSTRNTVIRSLHDLGAAAWFGGSLMGAIGVNGAASAVREPQDRARVASVGWAKWSPVNAAAIECETTHLADCEDDVFDRIFAVNVRSIFLCMKHEIRALLTGGGGTIVNICSTNFVLLPM